MKVTAFPIISALALVLPICVPGATVYSSMLNAANESPATSSPATGTITVTLTGDMLSVDETFSGLETAATAAHIHCCAASGTNAGIAIPFTNFPAATSGTYMQSFDLTSLSVYNTAFVTAEGGTAASSEAAFLAGLNGGSTYANIHDSVNPGGEIRGQLAATPEPGAAGLALLGIASLFGMLRRRRA